WLPRLLGDYRVTSKIENRVIDLYVADVQPLDGVVMIGDALQSVCPATGTGLSKVLTDVALLCEEYVPTWLRSADLPASAIAQFYRDARKLACDWSSLEAALYQRRLATDRSPLGWLHRRKTFADMALRGLCARLLGYEMTPPIALDRTTSGSGRRAATAARPSRRPPAPRPPQRRGSCPRGSAARRSARQPAGPRFRSRARRRRAGP